jgi:hypothetical protein
MLTSEQYQKWVEALESGNYAKGSGSLKRTVNKVDTYCCLGVLCVILGFKSEEDYTHLNEGLNLGEIPDTFWFFDAPTTSGLGVSSTYISPDIIPFEIQTRLADINDISASFVPVLAKIEELTNLGAIEVI